MNKTSATHPLRIDAVSVPGVAGVVGMTFCPGKKDAHAMSGCWDRDIAVDMRAVKDWGAKAIVSLMEPHEYGLLGVPGFAGSVPPGVERFDLPMPDGGVPDEGWEVRWKQAGGRLRSMLIWGGGIVIHCRGGLGRTGLVAARLLVELGMDAEEAIRTVRTARPGAIENAAQEEYARRQDKPHFPAMAAPSHVPDEGAASRYRGCLLGGAAGDALGAAVEFMSLPEIRQRFGGGGIRDFAPAYGRLGAVTDDTQMTLFTAEGLLRGHVRCSMRGIGEPIGCVPHAYARWLRTQEDAPPLTQEPAMDGWLTTHNELFSRRAPGNTCLEALRHSRSWTDRAVNNSKGCGGVMRVAPIGLYTAAFGMSSELAFAWGVDAAAITHGHPTGQLAAGALSAIIHLMTADGASPSQAVRTAKRLLAAEKYHEETLAAIEMAEKLAGSKNKADECLRLLGEGWVAEEALAIAVFCSLRAASIEEGVVMAVNITGDSDSTGSIAGNILGTYYGYENIPQRWLENLELKDVIAEIAEDIATVRQWYLEPGCCESVKPEESAYWSNKYPGW